MPFSLQARILFPVDQPPIENGVVTIDGERITAVGTKPPSEEVIDLGWTALIPGLVNAHTHLEFSHLREPLGQFGIPFVDWIRLIIAERGRSTHAPQQAAHSGLEESLACGVTTLGDITTGTLVPDADITHFHEVIGFSRARAESAMNALVQRIESHVSAGQWTRHGISPHAPYTVSPKLLKLLVAYARQHDLPIAMHLAESPQELQLLRDGTGPFKELLEERSMWDVEAIPLGSRPLDYLKILADAPRSLVIHGNFLDDQELKFMAARRSQMSLVYCPSTHAYFFPFGDAPYPLKKALDAGVRVALGTDSRASSSNLNLYIEMMLVLSRMPLIEPQQVLRMGTLSGAEALGREADVGSITPGKLANLVVLPIPDQTAAIRNKFLASALCEQWNDVLSFIMLGTAPTDVYLSGRPVRL